MIFKVYNEELESGFIMIESIKELADVCGVTKEEARKAYYRKAMVLNGYEVINYTH